MNAKGLLVLVLALIVACVQPNASGAQTLEPFINNGLLTTGYPEVAIFYDGAGGTCTATLIGCQTLLTAAHCVCHQTPAASCAPATSGSFVFFQHNYSYAVASIAVHPSYTANPGAGDHDLAVLRLGEPVVGLKPAQLGSAVPLGTEVQIVGFGKTDVLQSGIKRYGSATSAACNPGISASAICYNFEAPLGSPGSNSTACPGDSGGPMFANQGGSARLVGVTSGGNGPGALTCTAPVQGAYSSVSADVGWINSAATGGLGQASCGSLQSAGSGGSPFAGGTGLLAPGFETVAMQFNVPPGTATLLATLNSEAYAPWGPNDFDLHIGRGEPGPSNDLCVSESSLGVELCSISNPQPGTWYAAGTRFEGTGLVQLTATSFSAAPVGGCLPGPTTACILSGRFKIEVQWTDFSAVTRNAFVASAGTSDTALFYWTNPNNWELLIKGVNACSFNNKFWIYFAAATNVGYRVTVTDMQTGAAPKVYTNAVGNLAQATNDINAFSCP